MIEQLLKRLQEGDLSGLGDTNLAVELPVSVSLFQEIIDARPAGGPLNRLGFQFLEGDRALVELSANAPVVGSINRTLALQISGEYERGKAGLINFDIVDGLKIFDKPVINLLQGVVERKLPAGIDLNAKRVTVDFARLLPAIGQEHLLGLIAGARIGSRAGKIVIYLHFKS